MKITAEDIEKYQLLKAIDNMAGSYTSVDQIIKGLHRIVRHHGITGWRTALGILEHAALNTGNYGSDLFTEIDEWVDLERRTGHLPPKLQAQE